MTSRGSSRSAKVESSQVNYLTASTKTADTFFEENIVEEEKEDFTLSDEFETTDESAEDDADCTISWGSEEESEDLIIPGDWGIQGIEEKPWDDTKKPVVTFRNYKDLKLDENEKRGILSDRITASSSTYLDRSPETGKYVLCKLVLSRMCLTDVRILTYHHYIQYIDLSWNQLKDVHALDQLPFLMYLNVSHNQIEEVLNFKAPLNLTDVNYSYNFLTELRDLSDFWSIVMLDLSHNYIEVIEGLDCLGYLRHLNLSHNCIEKIENLNHLKLLTLNLSNNNISSYEEGDDVGFKTLNDLLHLNLDCNELKKLKVLEGVPTLQALKFRDNGLDDLIEVTLLNQLNFLTEVDFRDNPIVELDQYVEVCINSVRRISILDGEFVDSEKKVLVKNKFDPSEYITGHKSAATSLFLQHLNDPVLGLPVVPFDEVYVPVVILVGTPASNKGALIKTFCGIHPRNTIRGISHTTRPKIDDKEKDAYYFITNDEFWKLARKGEFLTVSQILGHSFGFSQNEIGKTSGHRRVLIIHMDMKGALTLRAKNSQAYLVLTMPSTEEIHTKFICKKYYNENRDPCGGATIVMNCPAKAKQFLEDSEKVIKTRNINLVTEIIDDIINTVVDDCVEGEHVSRKGSLAEVDDLSSEKSSRRSSGTDLYNLSEKSSRRSSTTIDVDRRISSMSATEPLGILKTSRRKLVTTNQAQIVTFNSEDTQYRYRSSPAGSARSVTFLDKSDYMYTEGNSISQTLIDQEEPLSVLSQTTIMEKRHLATRATAAATEIWTAQSDALNTIINDILNMREAYLQFHMDNPGLFSDVIYTDEEDIAMGKLTNLLKRCITQQSFAPASFEYDRDTTDQSMIATRLKQMHMEIKGEMSIGQKQLNESNFYTPQGTPVVSQLKKTKKEMIKNMASHRKTAVSYKLPSEIKLGKRTSSVPSLNL